MTLVLAIVLTAIVAGGAAVVVTTRLVRSRTTAAMGGRAGELPIDTHRRLLQEAQSQIDNASERAELLELSLDALTSGVIVTDAAGGVLVQNRLALDDAQRTHERTLVQATTSAVLARAIQGHASEREVEVYGPPPRTLHVHAVPVTTEGKVVGALAVIDDISEQRRVEKVRRDFIANLSHELRTPVGAASLLAEMVVGEEDPETRSQLTDRLLVETDRMTATIDGLLELSRLESDTEQSYEDSFNVQELIAEAVARNRVSAEAANVHVSTAAPADPVAAVGNRAQLLTAVVNLVENAIKYSAQGDSVSIRAHVEEATLSIIVRDTGRGIPARDLDRVFERFYRVDRSRDASTGGTGIGLSVVRHVAINHGGEVTAESFEGEGSTFTLSVPLVADAGSAGAVSQRMASSAQPASEVI